jgi:hypothetical protein
MSYASRQPRAVASYIIASVAAATVIFILPFHVPLSGPMDSESYRVGFNNRAAVLGTVLFLGVFYLLRIRSGRSGGGDGTDGSSPLNAAGSKARNVNTSSIAATALLYTLTTAYLYTINSSTDVYFGDSSYFLKRLDQILMGHAPYRDFSYVYGPALIYLPAYLHLLLAKLGVSVVGAYYLFYALVSCLGLVFLAYAVNAFSLTHRQRQAVFWAFAFLGWPHSMGPNYVYLRFITPLVSLIALHRVMRVRLASRSARRPDDVLLFTFMSVAAIGVNLAISPEMGVACCLAILVFTAAMAHRICTEFAYCLAPQLISLPAVAALFSTEYFRSISSFSGGALCFPVLPVPYMLLYLGSLLYAVPMSLSIARGSLGTDAPAVLGISGLCVFAMPAALGRSDFDHVFWNGLPVLLLAAIHLSARRPRLFWLYLACVLVVFTTYKVSWVEYSEAATIVRRTLQTAYQRGYVSEDTLARLGMQVNPRGFQATSLSYPELDTSTPIATPLGVPWSVVQYLQGRGQYMPDYYCDDDVDLPSQMSRKLQSLANAEYVLVPTSTLRQLGVQSASSPSEVEYFKRLFLWPFALRQKAIPFSSHHEIREYIRSRYEFVDHIDVYHLVYRLEGVESFSLMHVRPGFASSPSSLVLLRF